MTAGSQDPVEEGQVADAAVRGQVVEASRVNNQVVGAGQFRADGLECVAADEADVDSNLVSPVLRPRESRRGEVDGIHLESPRREEQGVSAWTATEVQGSARGDQVLVEAGGQAFVGLGHEEGDGPRTVGVEDVPKGRTVTRGPLAVLTGEQPVQERENILDGAHGPVHPAPFQQSASVGPRAPKDQVRVYISAPR